MLSEYYNSTLTHTRHILLLSTLIFFFLFCKEFCWRARHYTHPKKKPKSVDYYLIYIFTYCIYNLNKKKNEN